MNDKAILVLDDDDDFLAIVKKRIEDLGFRLVGKDEISKLPELIKNKELILIILDLKFNEELKGFEYLKSLKKKFLDSVPIVIASSEGATGIISHALELGASEFIKKPINRIQFRELVEKYSNYYKTNYSKQILTKINKQFNSAELSFPLMLEEVNHLGFVFSSVNLITKGVKIKLESDLIFEIFNKRSICVYVIKNDANETVDGDQISFRITTEVDPFDLEKIEMLKVWLGQIRNRRIL